jgi:hypothetical protein
MKKIIIITIISISLNCFNEKAIAQTQQPPADTLAWLQTNIIQQSSYYIGKSFGVLMDTLQAHGINVSSLDYLRSSISDGLPYSMPTDTVWTSKFSFFFKPFYSGTYRDQHDVNSQINTNVPYLGLTFIQKIPFLTSIDNNIYTGNILGPVIGTIRPYIISSIQLRTW